LPGITVNSEAILHHAASDCPNCGAAVSGNFCHQCGQETVLHPPSSREFMHEFIGHYVALEGKLWKSLALLLFRPGRLTLEYIKGRRVRYVQPLRLYLTFSLIFFAVMKFNTNVNVGAKHDADDAPPAHAAQPARTAPAEAGDKLPAAQKKQDEDEDDKEIKLIQEDKPGEFRGDSKKLHAWLAGFSLKLADSVVGKVQHFRALSGEEQKNVVNGAFYHYVPYAIFFMMPVFAFYLKVLYLGSGRRYGEHLLFALHTNAFAFLAMTLAMLPFLPGLVVFALWTWLTFYLPTAMRKVYGGSRKLTALRWFVLMFLHIVTLGLAIAAAMAYGVLH
jgi:hypothetical protein